MLREDEADGADDEELITQDVLFPFPLGVYHASRVYGPARSMLQLVFFLATSPETYVISHHPQSIALDFDRSSDHSRISFWYAGLLKCAKNHPD